MVTWAVSDSVLDNHNVSQFPRVSRRSFSLVPNMCIDKCALVESAVNNVNLVRSSLVHNVH